MDKNYLSYEQFGAIGDGQHDDIEAIIACHKEANRTGSSVKTKDSLRYKLGADIRNTTLLTTHIFNIRGAGAIDLYHLLRYRKRGQDEHHRN